MAFADWPEKKELRSFSRERGRVIHRRYYAVSPEVAESQSPAIGSVAPWNTDTSLPERIIGVFPAGGRQNQALIEVVSSQTVGIE
jgi:hypothetical protein